MLFMILMTHDDTVEPLSLQCMSRSDPAVLCLLIKKNTRMQCVRFKISFELKNVLH